MKIVVLGPKGRLGSELVRLGCTPFDGHFSDPQINKLKLLEPDVVINCAGKTDVDACERDIINTYLANAFGLERLANVFTGRFVQISTDYIFDGLAGPYDEGAFGNPLQTYGFSKFVAETLVHRFWTNSLIIRTTNLYDTGKIGKSNFALWVLDSLKAGKTLTVTDDLWGNPTYVPHLAKGILSAIDKKLHGTLNIVGETYCTRYEFAIRLARAFGFDPKNVIKGNFFIDAKRPRKGGLKTTLARSYGIPIFDLDTGIAELRLELEQHAN